MAMTHMRHIVIPIKKFPAIAVVKLDAFTTQDVHRLIVEKLIRRTKYLFTPLDHRRNIRTQ